MPSNSRKPIPPQTPTTPPKLIVPRGEAQQKIEAHIEKGREIGQSVIRSEPEMKQAVAEGDKWREYAIRLLASLFDTSSLADEYRDKTRLYGSLTDIPIVRARDLFADQMNNGWIKKLESILESLDLMQESPVVHQHVS